MTELFGLRGQSSREKLERASQRNDGRASPGIEDAGQRRGLISYERIASAETRIRLYPEFIRMSLRPFQESVLEEWDLGYGLDSRLGI
jgi:hypothetical protein